MQRVLVIKLGALGDLVQAFGPFQALRQAYPDAHISLLTTRPFMALARQSPWFDIVLEDTRPRWWDVNGLRRLRGHLAGHDVVFDLQTSGRSTRYHALAGRARWSGLVRHDPWFHANPFRDEMHTIARQADQLRYAGIPTLSSVDTHWLAAGAVDDQITAPYVVLVPGAAPHRPGKRWPVARFTALAQWLVRDGYQPVVVGTDAERALATVICASCREARDLTGQTDLPHLAALMSRAAWVIGNDTGPMHLAATMGAPATVLFSGESNPRLTAPIGIRPGQVSICEAEDISGITVETVVATRCKIL